MERLVNTSTLKIDPEFRDYLPPWSDTKRAEVERQILHDGRPREALVVWKGTGIVVEGQNRFGICQNHGLKVPIIEREFTDREAVKAFIDATHIGNDRGCNPGQNAIVLARHVDRLRKAGVKNAAEQVAESAGVDRRTVFRAANYAQALEAIPADIRKRIVSGEIKAAKEVVLELAGFGELHQRAIVAILDRGDYSSLAAAMRGNGGSNRVDEADGDDDVPFAEQPEPTEQKEPTEPAGTDGTEPAAVSDKLSPTPVSDEAAGKAEPPPAAKPRTPRPSRKPIKETFNEAQRQLSKVSRILDQVRGISRSEADYKDCRDKLKALSDAIESWSAR